MVTRLRKQLITLTFNLLVFRIWKNYKIVILKWPIKFCRCITKKVIWQVINDKGPEEDV